MRNSDPVTQLYVRKSRRLMPSTDYTFALQGGYVMNKMLSALFSLIIVVAISSCAGFGEDTKTVFRNESDHVVTVKIRSLEGDKHFELKPGAKKTVWGRDYTSDYSYSPSEKVVDGIGRPRTGVIRDLPYVKIRQPIYDYTYSVDFFNQTMEHKDKFRYYDRGEAYTGKGDYDRAIADYTKVIELKPSWALPYRCRGEAYTGKGDYDRAIADYTKAIEIDPRTAYFYHDRGQAYEKKGDYDRAIADYTKAVKLQPENEHFRKAVSDLKKKMKERGTR